MIILRPIIGDVEINVPIGFVLVDVEAATHVMNVGQIFAAAAILGTNIVLTLNTWNAGSCVVIVPVVMVDAIQNNNNYVSYYIIVTTTA